MPLPWKDIETRAHAFSKKWKDARDEASEAQLFLNDFFNSKREKSNICILIITIFLIAY